MLHQIASKNSDGSSSRALWRKFSLSEPAADITVEIRRRHDDKTILRRRSELPAAFDWSQAEWRPL